MIRCIKGVGLGLVIAREFVEKNGGTIQAISEEGKGSTFNFTLPLVGKMIQCYNDAML